MVYTREPKQREGLHDDVEELRERGYPGKSPDPDARAAYPGKGPRTAGAYVTAAEPGKRTRDGAMHPRDAIAYALAISDPAARDGAGLGSLASAFGFVEDPRRRIDRRAEPGRRDIDRDGLSDVHALLDEARGGHRLPRELEQRLSAQLGIDLSGVRVHTGTHAARVAAELGARAVTIDDDIYFAAGAYDPGSPVGIELIAHEVAHVAQHQRGGPVSETRVSRPDDAHEQDADRFAASFSAAPDAAALGFGSGEGVVARGDGGAGNQPTNGNAAAAGGATITHTTDQTAPGNPDDARTTVGVGEKVAFESDTDGAWVASAARGPKTKSGKSYTWLAPVTADAATVTVTFTPASGAPQITTMSVVTPTDVEFTKTSDLPIAAGTMGAGMKTNIKFLPLDVSFAFTSWLEIAGGPTGMTGYFTTHTPPNHTPNASPRHLGSDNAGPDDKAQFSGFPKPWADGFFEWVIPNHYVVDGEAGKGHKFTDIHQTATLTDTGRMTVTKGTAGGAKVTRDVDGTVAAAEVAAPESAVGFGLANSEPDGM